MVKRHLKRLTAPKSWKIKRKGITFVTRPRPGMHSKKNSISLNLVLRDMLSYAKTTRDVKMILADKGVLVDKKQVKDHRFSVGVMDIIEIPKINKCFRVLLNKKGNICLVEIKGDETKIKLCKIVEKTVIKKGKIQLNLNDGRNIIIDKNNYKTGDTLAIQLPEKKIKEHLKFEKGSSVYLSGGKHKGESGIVEEIKDSMIKVKPKSGESFETSKKLAFVIGREKPIITLS
ncbi:MAG: 30S ribosomal protein S4e [Nanoarchaeota archaeon]|nr:30S ribosomal protein S4e [Nanoarchaeota archaeon]MBU4283867.1 30S ribosomal protein S4e [Nanoarchaeota archaeon]MBU4493601.1 30S ribosomal protein S4e [Nanoarchaeota archaeon]